MGAVDDSVAIVAVVVFVLVYVITNEFSAAFVAVSIVVIIQAIEGKPNATAVADMIVIIVLMPDAIGIFFTYGFLAASVAQSILVIIKMMNTLQFIATNFTVAHAIFILLNTNVYQPYRASVTIVVIVFVDVHS